MRYSAGQTADVDSVQVMYKEGNDTAGIQRLSLIGDVVKWIAYQNVGM